LKNSCLESCSVSLPIFMQNVQLNVVITVELKITIWVATLIGKRHSDVTLV
jgi:hypothetical protein